MAMATSSLSHFFFTPSKPSSQPTPQLSFPKQKNNLSTSYSQDVMRTFTRGPPEKTETSASKRDDDKDNWELPAGGIP